MNVFWHTILKYQRVLRSVVSLRGSPAIFSDSTELAIPSHNACNLNFRHFSPAPPKTAGLLLSLFVDICAIDVNCYLFQTWSTLAD